MGKGELASQNRVQNVIIMPEILGACVLVKGCNNHASRDTDIRHWSRSKGV